MKKILLSLAAAFFGWTLAGTGRAAEPGTETRDVLVYKDGDRVQGRLVEQTATIIVFQSDRFGELKVLVENAKVIKAGQPAGLGSVAGAKPSPAALTAREKERAAERAELERLSLLEHLSPAAMAILLRDFFGPWHGKFAFSVEEVSTTAKQVNTGVEATLQRKWKSDEVQLKGRYDFSEANNLTTTDLIKADGLWRHDFPDNYFALYHSNLEWNRASFNNGVPNDYLQLQQEVGTGVSILPTLHRKVRVGVSENLFDIWNTTPGGTHSSRTVESAFLETELKLPWRMSLAQRGVYYYALANGKDGWENRIELSKKFTETFSTSLRQETRQYNPDGKTQDYSRLKLLFGLDF